MDSALKFARVNHYSYKTPQCTSQWHLNLHTNYPPTHKKINIEINKNSIVFTYECTNKVDGTATAGSDYEKTVGTLKFADGESVQPIIVKIFDDDAVEEDETFSVKLHNCSEETATISDSAVVTIIDDDEPGELDVCLLFEFVGLRKVH